MSDQSRNGFARSFRVVWSRGQGCAELAEALAGGHPIRAGHDVRASCIEHRADVLVARRMPSAPIVSTATPIDFDPSQPGSIAALVGGGPHTALVATVAELLGLALQVPVELVSGYRSDEERDAARDLLADLSERHPALHGRAVEARSARDLVDTLPDASLLVLGAPGGSWIQRMFLGPGARMTSVAQSGAVVVHSVPRLAFHEMVEPEYVSPLLGAADAALVGTHALLPVVDHRRLVGVVRRADLAAAARGVTVDALMEEPVWVEATAGYHEVGDVAAGYGVDTVPVVDGDGHLIGLISADPLR